MYALPNKTQHKLIVKVRGGISQKLDNLTSSSSSSSSSNSNQSTSSPFRSGPLLGSKHQLIDEAGFNAELSHLPQPIFHPKQEKTGNKPKSLSTFQRSQQRQQYITPEHNEMIKFVQSTWKGVERDYKKSVNTFINNLDLNNDSSATDHHRHVAQPHKAKRANTKKPATTSTPLLLTGSYHHISSGLKGTSSNQAKDSFQPFDLETFWGDRILKSLTKDL